MPLLRSAVEVGREAIQRKATLGDPPAFFAELNEARTLFARLTGH